MITTQARWLMHDWLFNKVAEEYALSADWDNRWRTGGTLDEVLDEAHLTPEWILEGIERFVSERPARLACLRRRAGCRTAGHSCILRVLQADLGQCRQLKTAERLKIRR